MHPVFLGQLAQDHVRSLMEEAEVDRLVHLAPTAHGLRRRTGLRLIALGNRLACEQRAGLAHGGRA